jgi:hypothetical protein
MTITQEILAEFMQEFVFDGVTYKGQRHWKDDVKRHLVENALRTALTRHTRAVVEAIRPKNLESPVYSINSKIAAATLYNDGYNRALADLDANVEQVLADNKTYA